MFVSCGDFAFEVKNRMYKQSGDSSTTPGHLIEYRCIGGFMWTFWSSDVMLSDCL